MFFQESLELEIYSGAYTSGAYCVWILGWDPGALFTKLHFLRNLLTFLISSTICHCKAFEA
jgi:hypothetical protein